MTMYAAVIDTLRFADRLKAAGFNDPQAEGMARALGEELADSMVTKRDLDAAVQSLSAAIEALDAKFESRFEAVDAKFVSIDARFEAMEAWFESRFEAVDAKLEAQHREFSGKFNVLFATMALGFTLVIGLIGYSLFSTRATEPNTATAAVGHETVAPLVGQLPRG